MADEPTAPSSSPGRGVALGTIPAGAAPTTIGDVITIFGSPPYLPAISAHPRAEPGRLVDEKFRGVFRILHLVISRTLRAPKPAVGGVVVGEPALAAVLAGAPVPRVVGIAQL
jgi:hypothetical protein